MSAKEVLNVAYNYTGKTILITGAADGIGRDIALSFARSGGKVCAADKNGEGLTLLSEEIQEMGGGCITYQADLSNSDECIQMAEYFINNTNRVDILINNAGLSFPELLIDLNVNHWDITLNVNLRAPAIITKVVSSHMIEMGGGAIVNITSNAGIGGIEEHAAYCASKFGFHGLAKVMAIELGPHNIRVNSVAPTVVLTPMGRQVWDDPEKSDPVKKQIPLGRFAWPSEVTNTVLFLASDAATMIHGDIVLVDGGADARLY
jgi:NAD(P)-dependent dehydrogenase (short-subunit alcohol dehydrogenase family)